MLRLLRLLFGRSPRRTQPDPDSPEFAAALERAKSEFLALGRPAIALRYEPGNPVPEGPVSSIGGRPSLPPDMSWPVSIEGRPMQFLAQLAYGEVPELEHYPRSGMLSFFVPATMFLGLFDEEGEPIKGRPAPFDIAVLWFESTEALERRDPPAFERRFDVFGEALRTEGAPLTATAYTGYPSGSCNEFSAIAAAHVDGDPHEDLWDFAESLGKEPLHFGGYPDFIQHDVRDPDAVPPVSEVLLQMGWTRDAPREWQVCWGDAGEATFLMTKEDLIARRFDRLTYNWDCG